MRLQTYRDESRSRHFDLIFGGDHPRSIDLVLVNFGHVGGGFCVRPGPLRIDGRPFEPMGSLKTRKLKSAKGAPPREGPLQ
jgi:hypothetical protein